MLSVEKIKKITQWSLMAIGAMTCMAFGLFVFIIFLIVISQGDDSQAQEKVVITEDFPLQ